MNLYIQDFRPYLSVCKYWPSDALSSLFLTQRLIEKKTPARPPRPSPPASLRARPFSFPRIFFSFFLLYRSRFDFVVFVLPFGSRVLWRLIGGAGRELGNPVFFFLISISKSGLADWIIILLLLPVVFQAVGKKVYIYAYTAWVTSKEQLGRSVDGEGLEFQSKGRGFSN